MLDSPTTHCQVNYYMENATNRLLDEVKTRLDITSDNQLAARLGVTRQRIAQYRRGDTDLNDDRCLEFAEILGVAPENILLEIQAERARKSGHFKVSAVLESVLSRLNVSPQQALFTLAAVLLAPTFAGSNSEFFSPLFLLGMVPFHLTGNINYAQFAILSHVILCGFPAICQAMIAGLFCSSVYYTLSWFLLHKNHGFYDTKRCPRSA